MQILSLNSDLKAYLKLIGYSQDNEVKYWPSSVVTTGGEFIENVCFAEVNEYLRHWGIMPNLDPDKKQIHIQNVQKIQETPNRLPAKFANSLYSEGESGMGYYKFKVVFKDGEESSYVTGSLVDFIKYPNGYSQGMIDNIVHHKTNKNKLQKNLEYVWCLFNGAV